MSQRQKIALYLMALAACAGSVTNESFASTASQKVAPSFSFDTTWMHTPEQWVLGVISGVHVDRHGNIWILHRPRTIPEARRAQAAPPVLEFGPDGHFIRAWGGKGAGYDWPANEHSIVVDDKDRVWITGSSRVSGAADQMILTFDMKGNFLRQIGAANASRGDLDTDNVNAPADLFIDLPRHELYVADGYGNRRVIVFDSETGAYKRMWAAFGAAPSATPPPPLPPLRRPESGPIESGDGPDQFRSVHGVELSRDGHVYVSDRDNSRVQVFNRMGKFERQVFVHRASPSRQSASGIGLSADRDQRWLYVIDPGSSQLVVFDRKSMKPVADIGGPGKAAGQFSDPHLLSVNSKGTIFVTELTGGRVQKLTPLN